MDEAPWGDLYGRPLTTRRLAQELERYGVRPVEWKEAGVKARGYVTYSTEATKSALAQTGLSDAWSRYLESGETPGAPKPGSGRRNYTVLGWCVLAALFALVISSGALRGNTMQPSAPALTPALTPRDTQYLALLDKYGIQYTTPAAAIDVGHNTANLYNQGWGLKQIVYYNQDAARRAHTLYTNPELDYLTSAAVSCYATNPSPTDPKLQGFCTR